MKKLAIAFLLATGLLIPGIKAVSAGQERPSPTITYVVEPGDTLWSIAARHRPEEDRRKVIHELMELNDLGAAGLVPGQSVRLPSP